MSSVGPRGKGCIWWVYGIRNGILLYETACHGYFWNLMVAFYDLFFLITCLEKLSHWVGKAAVYTITRQPVVGQPNPTNLISFLIKQHLQFTGWSAKEFFRGILIYLPPKCGRTPKSVTSSSKHSFWPTNGCGRWLVPVKPPKHSHCCFSGLQKCEWSWVGEVHC